MPAQSALAIFAHPDDIEFLAAGTLLLLAKAGWEIHYLNLSSGNLGSTSGDPEATAQCRAQEAGTAAGILGAHSHPSLCQDLAVFYNQDTLARLAAVIREVAPRIILTHSPSDYMEDHQNTSRLAVTAAFARGMPNYTTSPARPAIVQDVVIYHALPHSLRDPLRRRIIPGAFVDTTSVHALKRQALAAHASQKAWLDVSQGMDSYLTAMDDMSREVGRMSGAFKHAEGWRRHLHYGFSASDQDPLAEALPEHYLMNQAYEDHLNY